jgi:hypothetical protein
LDEISRNKSIWIAKSIALFILGLFFSICIGISSATDIEIPDIEEGDIIYATIEVDSPGQVGVTARTNGSNNDNIKLYLYNQTHLVASASGSYDQVSIGDLPLPTGEYTVKAYLTDTYGGGNRIISITSNSPLSILQKYRKSVFGVVDGKANWSELIVDQEGWVFVNAWTNGSNNDNIELYLSNQTHLVASSSGSYDQVSITYLAPSPDIYIVKAYLTDAYAGGTRTISVTSNCFIDKNGEATPAPSPTSTSTLIPTPTPRDTIEVSMINVKRSSETSPEINFETIKEQNLPNEKYVLIGSASSESGIKSVIINGKYVGTEHWSVNLSGNNNTYILAMGNDGNTTLANISLSYRSSEKERDSWMSKLGLSITFLSFLFGSGIIIKIFKKAQNNKE